MDNLLCPTQFGNDFFVGQCSQTGMTPGVHFVGEFEMINMGRQYENGTTSNLVSTHIFCLQDSGQRNGTRTNREEGRLKVVLIKKRNQIRGIGRRPYELGLDKIEQDEKPADHHRK